MAITKRGTGHCPFLNGTRIIAVAGQHVMCSSTSLITWTTAGLAVTYLCSTPTRTQKAVIALLQGIGTERVVWISLSPTVAKEDLILSLQLISAVQRLGRVFISRSHARTFELLTLPLSMPLTGDESTSVTHSEITKHGGALGTPQRTGVSYHKPVGCGCRRAAPTMGGTVTHQQIGLGPTMHTGGHSVKPSQGTAIWPTGTATHGTAYRAPTAPTTTLQSEPTAVFSRASAVDPLLLWHLSIWSLVWLVFKALL